MILLRNAEVHSPEPLGRHDVLVGGGRILAMAPHLAAPPWDNAPGWDIEVLDLDGAPLVPGLVDAHTHLTGGGGEGGARTKVPPVALTAFTRAGVTTAIGLLGTDGTTRSIAELLAAARGLDELGLTALCYTGGYEVPPVTLTGSVRGDLVHVDRIVAVGELALSDHRSSQPTYDELVRIAADAHVAGLMTGKAGLVHLHLGDGPRGLALVRRALNETELPARVFHPTHTNRNRRLWEEAKALGEAFAPRGLHVDVSAFESDGDAPSGGQALAEWVGAGLDPARLTLSSDGGGCLPTFDRDGALLHMDVGSSDTLLVAVREAVVLGVPFNLALATCTANVARLFRLARKGRIAVGADADLVVLTPDLHVRDVIAGGRWMVRGGVPEVRGPFER
ncbi:MAG: beta-aspartyl-peptidase [Pseudomonadota bacterium]|nr:beta-aspartyl-peptidase [Pseudomonadota bacterium]